jgi:hypothetical protein
LTVFEKYCNIKKRQIKGVYMDTANSGSFIASLLPAIIFAIPFLILNTIISKRKGKNRIKYFFLSLIPGVGICLTIYLCSLLDKDIEEKINKIYEKLIE